MYRKEFSKVSQDLRWSDADQNDSFSDSSYLFPVQRILQNWAMIARTEANSILDVGLLNEKYPLLVGSSSGTFFGKTNALGVMQWLIAWLNNCSWHLLLTIAQFWAAPVFVLGHSWPAFSLFLPVQSFLFSLLSTEFFISPSVQNAEGGGSIISQWPSYVLSNESVLKNHCAAASASLSCRSWLVPRNKKSVLRLAAPGPSKSHGALFLKALTSYKSDTKRVHITLVSARRRGLVHDTVLLSRTERPPVFPLTGSHCGIFSAGTSHVEETSLRHYWSEKQTRENHRTCSTHTVAMRAVSTPFLLFSLLPNRLLRGQRYILFISAPLGGRYVSLSVWASEVKPGGGEGEVLFWRWKDFMLCISGPV